MYILLTGMGASRLAGMGRVLFGITFLCSSGGLPSGLASALLLDKLSLLISFSSLGISSLNLKGPQSRKCLCHSAKMENLKLFSDLLLRSDQLEMQLRNSWVGSRLLAVLGLNQLPPLVVIQYPMEGFSVEPLSHLHTVDSARK